MLNKELSHFAEHNKSDNQIAEYICNTYLDKSEEVELNSSENDDKLDSLPQSSLNRIKSLSNANLPTSYVSRESENISYNNTNNVNSKNSNLFQLNANNNNNNNSNEMTISRNETSTPIIPKLTVDLFNNAQDAANEGDVNQSKDENKINHVRFI